VREGGAANASSLSGLVRLALAATALRRRRCSSLEPARKPARLQRMPPTGVVLAVRRRILCHSRVRQRVPRLPERPSCRMQPVTDTRAGGRTAEDACRGSSSAFRWNAQWESAEDSQARGKHSKWRRLRSAAAASRLGRKERSHRESASGRCLVQFLETCARPTAGNVERRSVAGLVVR
jgi:hypothetical protein